MLKLYDYMKAVQSKPNPIEPIAMVLNIKEEIKYLINYVNSITSLPNFLEDYC
jgi:hypothetical protein